MISFPESARWLPEGFAEAGFDGNVEFCPAFDGPTKSEGIGDLKLTFWLRGPKGAVAWELLTGCFLPSTQKTLKASFFLNPNTPTPGAVDWHSPVSLFDGQPSHLDCRLLGPGTPCYADAGHLLGNQAYEALVTGGEMALWLFLREKYDDVFDDV